MSPEPIIQPLGEQAILITFEPEISEEVLEKVLQAENIIAENLFKEEVEVITSYCSLLVIYHSPIEDVYNKIFFLKQLLKQEKVQKKLSRKLFKIPVCYSSEFGLDLEQVSVSKNLSVEEIVRLHSEQIYTVFFTGFLPGFLYLGKLSRELNIPRKKEPRQRIEKGAVGLAEDQTGIYPQVSPGGWQIIGNCPVQLFNVDFNPSCEITAGDKIQFYPIGLEEHQEISEKVRRGEFQLEKEKYEG